MHQDLFMVLSNSQLNSKLIPLNICLGFRVYWLEWAWLGGEQRMMALYVASHYKNTPNDLQLMSDAPAHHLFVLLGELLQDHLHVPFVCEVVVIIRLFKIWTWEVLLRFLPLDMIVNHIYGFFFNRSGGWDTKCTTWHSLCSSGMSPLSNLTFIRGHTWNWIEALCRLKALVFIMCWCT